MRALLARNQRALLDFLADCARDAQAAGELPPESEAEQIAFEVDSVLAGADVNYLLFDDPGYLDRGAVSVRRLLGVTD